LNHYEHQVRLLLRVLPLVDYEDPSGSGLPFFALKGGTALNFFHWDLPRLSVDIDLTYCPLVDRETALRDIASGLERIAQRIPTAIPGARSRLGPEEHAPKLFVRLHDVEIKVEPNSTARGSVFPTEVRTLRPKIVERFEMDVHVRSLSAPDLFGGKLCAALDRQHPRDLFDANRILDTVGFTDPVRAAFLVYLIGHNRPIAEILNPNFKPLGEIFEKEFYGMALEKVSLDALESARDDLVATIKSKLTRSDKEFLLSLKKGDPIWELLNIPHAKDLPAVKWKMYNISKLKQNKDKHSNAIEKLEDVLLSMGTDEMPVWHPGCGL